MARFLATTRWFAALWMLALVSIGCQKDLLDGLETQTQEILAQCDHENRSVQEGCVRNKLYLNARISGEQGAIVCSRMSDALVADPCWEAVATLGAPYAPDSVCDRIESPRMAASCRLVLAERISRQHAPPEEVLPACERAAPLIDECLFHYAMLRVEYYRESGGIGVLLEEMEKMVKTSPMTVNSQGFGTGMAMAAATLQTHLSQDKPCDLLPSDSEAEKSCRIARDKGLYWTIHDGKRMEGSKDGCCW